MNRIHTEGRRTISTKGKKKEKKERKETKKRTRKANEKRKGKKYITFESSATSGRKYTEDH